MKTYPTEIKAIDPLTGEMKTWAGPEITAPTYEDAMYYAKNYMGYCKVLGEKITEEQ